MIESFVFADDSGYTKTEDVTDYHRVLQANHRGRMPMNIKQGIRIFGFAISGLVGPGIASAGCQCACVNGTVQAICQSAIDLKPICAPTVCPIAPPAVTPITAPKVPPIGASHCAPRQVYDPSTGQYVWKDLCE